jgi:hypothetical protein
MTAAGLVVTDLSHLGVGLDGRGDFRGLVRVAVSSKPSRPSRRCDLCINVVRWVGACGESCPLMSISPARGMAGSLTVVMAVPPPTMPRVSGRLVVWFTVRARLFRGDRGGGGATARQW